MIIRSVRAVPLRVALVDPFVLANARLDHVDNVAVKVVLQDGSEGWGEIGTLHPITEETFDDAVRVVESVSAWLPGHRATDPIGDRLRARVPGFAASRAGIEQACWDAAARSNRVPLWRRFGDTASAVVTDVTVPICSTARATELARSWRSLGFTTLKVKVGIDIDADLQRLAAICAAAPAVGLVIDANEGWTAEQALAAVATCKAAGGRVLLLEQPVPRADLDALARLTRDAGVPVAADEACKTVADVERIGRERLASVVNVKLAKSGVEETVRMLAAARRLGLGTMIGAMVETRIGTGFSAHLAAGIGGFSVIDLDTPWLMAGDPVSGGTALDGPRWLVENVPAGHGGCPA
jgi:L-alanine-DL-glutamate epimerase-like enolase superfamily enzyme